MSVNLTLLHSQADLDKAVGHAVAAVALSVAVLILGILVLFRRRCCNSRAGCCRGCGDGSVIRYGPWRYLCLFTTCVVAAEIITVATFFASHPWLVQYQAGPVCETDTQPVGPCRMSYQVFYLGVFSNVFILVVAVLGWGTAVWACPLSPCFQKTYGQFVQDDLIDVGISEDEQLQRYTAVSTLAKNRLVPKALKQSRDRRLRQKLGILPDLPEEEV